MGGPLHGRGGEKGFNFVTARMAKKRGPKSTGGGKSQVENRRTSDLGPIQTLTIVKKNNH